MSALSKPSNQRSLATALTLLKCCVGAKPKPRLDRGSDASYILQVGVATFLRRIFIRFGVDVRRVGPANDLTDHLVRLTDRGVPLQWAYDIGAHQGEWTANVLQKLPDPPSVVMFEPNKEHLQRLGSTKQRAVGALLGDSNQMVNFWSISGTGDSIFPENSHFYSEVSPTLTQMRRLDDLVTELDLPLPDLIKLDTQGSELSILRGAPTTLKTASLIYLELPLLQYNSGAPTLTEYINFLTEQGFLPVGLYEVHFSQGVVIQFDMLFMSTRLYETLHGSESANNVNKFIP